MLKTHARMKIKVLQFFKIYFLFLLIFVIQKPFFMIWYYDLYKDISLRNYGEVIWHGLKLDASVAAYLTILPGLFLIFSLWIKPDVMKQVQKIYYGFISFVLSVIFVADLGLYKYWGFRLDSTPLFYMRSPKSALASVDWLVITGGTVAIILLAILLYFVFYKVIIKPSGKVKLPYRTLPVAGCLFLLTIALIIPIRGGFTVSTMNVGKVYFSSDLVLNHAAINPFFSLMESLMREQNFSKQYRFMEDKEARKIFEDLTEKPVMDSIPSLFKVKRPNVVMIILESFMSRVMEPLNGFPDLAVRMNKLSEEGILFTNFYANSFRTDRGLVSILSGYPAQPTTSIMKYPRKSQTLPSIPKSLKEAGYTLQYYYGGDADFTNMRSYLTACGIEDIISDKDFSYKERLSKWGAHDDIVFSRMQADLEKEQSEPFMKILQTSSSHEPFEVPYYRLDDPYLNSVAYADSCLGAFIDAFKKTEYWDNSVVLMVADHGMRYPADLSNRDTLRYRIPLLIVGGAVKIPAKIDTYASQIDIAATLLYQLGISYEEFLFSKNILNPASPHFVFFTSPNFFGMITPDNQLIFDCDLNEMVTDTGIGKGKNLQKGQAFLQVLYDDLDKR